MRSGVKRSGRASLAPWLSTRSIAAPWSASPMQRRKSRRSSTLARRSTRSRSSCRSWMKSCFPSQNNPIGRSPTRMITSPRLAPSRPGPHRARPGMPSPMRCANRGRQTRRSARPSMPQSTVPSIGKNTGRRIRTRTVWTKPSAQRRSPTRIQMDGSMSPRRSRTLLSEKICRRGCGILPTTAFWSVSGRPTTTATTQASMKLPQQPVAGRS